MTFRITLLQFILWAIMFSAGQHLLSSLTATALRPHWQEFAVSAFMAVVLAGVMKWRGIQIIPDECVARESKEK